MSLALVLAAAGGLVAWARWLSRQPGAPRFLRHFPWMLAVPCLLCTVVSTLGMIGTFDSVAEQGLDAAERQARLDQGISRAMLAMNATYAALGVAALLLLFLTWKHRWSAPHG